jgi:hypothetical protein
MLASVAIALIVMAIDIPTTKWMLKYSVRRKKPLWRILHDAVTQEEHDEIKPPANTYTEAFTRMQEREKARSERSARHRHSS